MVVKVTPFSLVCSVCSSLQDYEAVQSRLLFLVQGLGTIKKCYVQSAVLASR